MGTQNDDFLAYQWTGKLKAYYYHLNSEHAQAIVYDFFKYFSIVILSHVPKNSSVAKLNSKQQLAALMLLYDRGLVDRIVLDEALVSTRPVSQTNRVVTETKKKPHLQVRFRPHAETESELIQSKELVPVIIPLMELVGIMRQAELNDINAPA